MILKKGIAFLLITSMLVSCSALQNTNNKQRGGAIGAAGGALIGGILGNNLGNKKNSALGSILGGVIGGAAGVYIGNKMDKQAEAIRTAVPGAEVTRVGEGINVTFDETSGIHFNTNEATVDEQTKTTLLKLAAIFKEYPDSNILVEGHTDSDGSEAYNLELSRKRANAISNHLQGLGVPADRFTTKWYGEVQPKYSNDTAEGKSKNRRVELAVVANETLKKQAKAATK
ncbi:OmpA family protein [Flavicella sediminum]|uniref:OmpA family protein n=1 Tax=Flavicella sediminum TaxID=2585141 RepID=UPI0011200CD1|nr:OmpA family protein [Flavicella sediminum]